METNNFEEVLQPIAESLLLSGALEEAHKAAQHRKQEDIEWSTPKYYHVHNLVTAFATGVLQADPWHKNYKIPPNLENVVNWISFCLQKDFPEKDVIKISLCDLEKKYRKWAWENPYFLKWNESPKETIIAVTSRYSEVPEERDFIDLDAIINCVVIYLRDQTRINEAFDEAFEK